MAGTKLQRLHTPSSGGFPKSTPIEEPEVEIEVDLKKIPGTPFYFDKEGRVYLDPQVMRTLNG